MRKKIILIDQDDVIADFNKFFIKKWKEKYPEKSYIPIKKRKSFYIEEDYPKEQKELVRSIYHAEGFIRSLPPIKRGIEAILEIDKLGHNVFICTSPLSEYKNCVLEKYEWVEKYLGKEWTKKIILTKDKTVIGGDVLIDDRPEFKGEMIPKWEYVIFDQPYNRHIKDKKRIVKWNNWKKVLEL